MKNVLFIMCLENTIQIGFKLHEIRTKLFIHTHRVLNGRAFADIQERVLIKSYG